MDRKIGPGIAFAVALGVAAPALAQQAVQWRVEDGGNGHWYQRIADGMGPHEGSWHFHRSRAESRGGAGVAVLVGGTGYLIYLNVANEAAAKQLAKPITKAEIDALPIPVPRDNVRRRNRELCDLMRHECLLTRLADCDPIGGGRCYLCWMRCTGRADLGKFPPWPDELYPGASCKYWEYRAEPE